jgi:hypothetical protein
MWRVGAAAPIYFPSLDFNLLLALEWFLNLTAQ